MRGNLFRVLSVVLSSAFALSVTGATAYAADKPDAAAEYVAVSAAVAAAAVIIVVKRKQEG